MMRVCIAGASGKLGRYMVQHALDQGYEVVVFSCGWHITRDGKDVYPWKLKAIVKVLGPLARLARFADLNDR